MAKTEPAHPSAPAGIPVLELQRRLDVVAEVYAWYCRDLARLVWAKQPDTIGMCQELQALEARLDKLIIAAEHAREHARLLFDLSFNEGTRRGLHGDPKERSWSSPPGSTSPTSTA